ncbi:hypothetical protein OpiT1DRAFT_00641 [Opitutaceae bacterium TAV1]|nr:hypothetical protein OpiT1DRAFT_00641 [Opitutaceae bacterium TAV1]
MTSTSLTARILQLAALAATLTFAPLRAVEVTTGVDFASSYVFHGMTYSNGPVLQPWAVISGKSVPLVLTIWTNFEIEGDHSKGVFAGAGAREFSEFDLFLTYPLPVTFMDLDFTFGYYTYPADDVDIDSEMEIQFGGSKDLSAWLNGFPVGVFFRAGYMFTGEVEHNIYIEGGLQGEVPLVEKLSLTYKARVGWLKQAGSADDGWSDYQLTIGLGYILTDSVSLSITANYIGQFDDDVLSGFLYEKKFYVTVGASYTF